MLSDPGSVFLDLTVYFCLRIHSQYKIACDRLTYFKFAIEYYAETGWRS